MYSLCVSVRLFLRIEASMLLFCCTLAIIFLLSLPPPFPPTHFTHLLYNLLFLSVSKRFQFTYWWTVLKSNAVLESEHINRILKTSIQTSFAIFVSELEWRLAC